jgi:lysophospholipase L1-like esterase
MTRRRLYLFRLLALLFPVLVLGVLELGFRVAGAYGPESGENAHVSYVTGEEFFPAWKSTLQMPKPKGTVRIFALGGSTTWGSGSARPFVTHLRDLLARRGPNVRYEVINGGMVAFGTHRVFEVMKEAAAFDPDIYVVYTGHNEFLEEIFFDPEGLLAQQERLARLARGFRVVNFVRSLVGEQNIPRVKLPRPFSGNTDFPMIRDDEQYRLRLEFLRSNLRQMVQLARASGVELILAPAVPNLLWEPEYPEHGPGYATRADDWDAGFRQAGEHCRVSRNADALDVFREIHEIDDRFALSHFLEGLVHLADGDARAGVAALRRANLLDRAGDRANGDVARVIREVGTEADVPIVDLWPAFCALIPDEFQKGRSGNISPLMVDRCHPGDRGHAMIARALADAVLER